MHGTDFFVRDLQCADELEGAHALNIYRMMDKEVWISEGGGWGVVLWVLSINLSFCHV